LRLLLIKQPDLTLEEIRTRLGLGCTIQAIHYVLVDMGLTYKKRRSAPQNNPDLTSPAPAGSGARFKKGSFPPDSSFSTSRQPKRT
jgi:transposase